MIPDQHLEACRVRWTLRTSYLRELIDVVKTFMYKTPNYGRQPIGEKVRKFQTLDSLNLFSRLETPLTSKHLPSGIRPDRCEWRYILSS